MTVRQLKDLKWAKRLDARPPFIPKGAPRGIKRVGVAYENALAGHLKAQFEHGVWWEYEDSNGLGWCQTDFIGEARKIIYILECKLSWKLEAEDQLDMYRSVVQVALQKPVACVLVCKNLRRGLGRQICSNLEDALNTWSWTEAPRVPVWHHLGGVPRMRGFESRPPLTSWHVDP